MAGPGYLISDNNMSHFVRMLARQDRLLEAPQRSNSMKLVQHVH
jgi:hypothetical protein